MRQGIRVDRDGRYHSSERSHVVPLQGPGCAQSGEWRGGRGGGGLLPSVSLCVYGGAAIRAAAAAGPLPSVRARGDVLLYPSRASCSPRAQRGKLPAGARGIPRGALVPAGRAPAASRGGGSPRAPRGSRGALVLAARTREPAGEGGTRPPAPRPAGRGCGRPAPRHDDADSVRGRGAGSRSGGGL